MGWPPSVSAAGLASGQGSMRQCVALEVTQPGGKCRGQAGARAGQWVAAWQAGAGEGRRIGSVRTRRARHAVSRPASRAGERVPAGRRLLGCKFSDLSVVRTGVWNRQRGVRAGAHPPLSTLLPWQAQHTPLAVPTGMHNVHAWHTRPIVRESSASVPCSTLRCYLRAPAASNTHRLLRTSHVSGAV